MTDATRWIATSQEFAALAQEIKSTPALLDSLGMKPEATGPVIHFDANFIRAMTPDETAQMRIWLERLIGLDREHKTLDRDMVLKRTAYVPLYNAEVVFEGDRVLLKLPDDPRAFLDYDFARRGRAIEPRTKPNPVLDSDSPEMTHSHNSAEPAITRTIARLLERMNSLGQDELLAHAEALLAAPGQARDISPGDRLRRSIKALQETFPPDLTTASSSIRQTFSRV